MRGSRLHGSPAARIRPARASNSVHPRRAPQCRIGPTAPRRLTRVREVRAHGPRRTLRSGAGGPYEMFREDADPAARVLGLALTARGDGGPLAGVPAKAAADSLRPLTGPGRRVAICEQ